MVPKTEQVAQAKNRSLPYALFARAGFTEATQETDALLVDLPPGPICWTCGADVWKD